MKEKFSLSLSTKQNKKFNSMKLYLNSTNTYRLLTQKKNTSYNKERNKKLFTRIKNVFVCHRSTKTLDVVSRSLTSECIMTHQTKLLSATFSLNFEAHLSVS